MTPGAGSTPFEVRPYSIDGLVSLLADCSGAEAKVIIRKNHIGYFESYFGESGVKARTILVERDYVDRDYLEDYSGYYSRCFADYERKCARLHFFSESIEDSHIIRLVRGETSEDERARFQKSYLGFVVVKPLPETIFGRTCLATYPEANPGRAFPIVRWYAANLFGMELHIETLAFQEQDHAVSACATSALWSVFQGTGQLFHHAFPSPVEITRAAAIHYPLHNRPLPSEGLTPLQMAAAIRSLGLEPTYIEARDPDVFRSTAYAYLRGRIPLVLGIELVQADAGPPDSMGLHAVALTGYSLDEAPTQGNCGFRLTADRITKVYAHDDQVGPFARMEFSKDPALPFSLSTGWTTPPGASVHAQPMFLLVPLYHKIRIPFLNVHRIVREFDAILKLVVKGGLPHDWGDVEWDIHLATINDFKSEILRAPAMQPESREEVLLAGLPRFLWRATARAAAQPVLGLLFDATDIEQGSFFLRAIEYDCGLFDTIRAIAQGSKNLLDALEGNPAWQVFMWFKNRD